MTGNGILASYVPQDVKNKVTYMKQTRIATDHERTSEEESLRQKEAVLHAGELVKQLEGRLGRQPTCCVTTFGCQMNTEHEIEKAA